VLDRIEMIEQGLKDGPATPVCTLSEERPGFEAKGEARKPQPKTGKSMPYPPFEHGSGPETDRGRSEAVNAMPPPAGLETMEGIREAAPEERGAAWPAGVDPARDLSYDPSPQSSVPCTPSSVLRDWPAFVASLESRNPILWAKVSHCTVRVSGESLELEVPDIFETSANGPEFIRNLEDASQAFFGSRLQWIIIKKEARTSRGAAAQGRKTGKPSGVKQIAGHPAVQQAIEILGAELIEVKPAKRPEPDRSQ